MSALTLPREQVEWALLSAEVEASKRARQDLVRYTKLFHPNYQAAQVHRAIAQVAERAITEPGYRAIVVVPPRFGKSVLLSASLPGYAFGRRPDLNIIAASHTQDLANHFSRQARNMITHPDYPWRDITIAGDAGAVKQWEIESPRARRRGIYSAVGVGGSPAGKGAELLLIDDPVANREDAFSPAIRDKMWEWFKTDIMTRLNPGGSAILVMTRWHWDDLAGRILREDQEEGRWDYLHFPAILPSGESIDPVRWPVPELEKRRQEVGSYVWWALYQGEPSPDEGAIIKRDWFPLFDALPPGVLHLVQSWDTAFKTGDTSDWSVCHTYAVTVYGIHLIGRFKERLDFVDLERAAIEQYDQFKPRMVYIEDKASGQSLGQVIARKTSIPYQMVPVPKSKVQRVYEATPWLESGRVQLPRWLPGLDDLLAELTAFPYGAHDDDVDAMTQAVLQVFGDATPALESASYLEADEEDEELSGWTS